ncbi:hypothetical protein E2C01_032700 [Portunus trituberculatus]|uniref:Uncharacterized protein n=1 Tax=Portunus trituberculatus TaxID=210409 RepID=A0A5B7F0A5_PORTR|nr:hypothetical protein [Portunus trituberculatus]
MVFPKPTFITLPQVEKRQAHTDALMNHPRLSPKNQLVAARTKSRMNRTRLNHNQVNQNQKHS